MRAIAIDWSGKAAGAAEFIWLAEADDGRLTTLENGWSRSEVVAEVEARTAGENAVVGLDFAFSFPRWWCRRNGWKSAAAVWRAAADDGEEWLSACAYPFWGRPGVKKLHSPEEAYRRTDMEMPLGPPKSVFQIGGAGAVGTGSVRGMPHLLSLADAGFSVWPFDGPATRRVLEIYPRVLTGDVNKSRWRRRLDFLRARFPSEDSRLTERAAGSEDAFDAAVSALVMSEHADDLHALGREASPHYRIEGRIWTP
jgi:hypothetical protein